MGHRGDRDAEEWMRMESDRMGVEFGYGIFIIFWASHC